jgi:uncharacterized protein YidB (DUF937 family)
MGLLDDLIGGSGNSGSGLGAIAAQLGANPQLLQAVTSLLSNREGSLGGPGGLGALINMFQSKGLGDVVGSWVGGGPNQAIAPAQVTNALGPDLLGEFAKMAGIDAGDAGSVLANVLPGLVNHVTPQGQVPDAGSLESMLGGLLGQIGR